MMQGMLLSRAVSAVLLFSATLLICAASTTAFPGIRPSDKRLHSTFSIEIGKPVPILALVHCDDGSRFAAATENRVYLFDSYSGKRLADYMDERMLSVRSLAFWQNDHTVLVGLLSGDLVSVDFENRLLSRLANMGTDNTIWCMSVGDRSQVVLGLDDGSVAV